MEQEIELMEVPLLILLYRCIAATATDLSCNKFRFLQKLKNTVCLVLDRTDVNPITESVDDLLVLPFPPPGFILSLLCVCTRLSRFNHRCDCTLSSLSSLSLGPFPASPLGCNLSFSVFRVYFQVDISTIVADLPTAEDRAALTRHNNPIVAKMAIAHLF